MILKHADDKSKRLALLQDLQNSPVLDQRQKRWLREELIRLREGMKGEKESAFFLDQYFKGGENHVLLHDLRISFEGDTAQIDHLIFNRGIGAYLIETKNYSGNVIINEHGEFTVDYGDDRLGVPSPIEQSQRHARILQRLLERLEIKSRTGGPLQCYHVVMFHPKAVISRPKKTEFDTSNVIKADQFPSWHEQFVDKEFGVTKLLQAAANLRSLDTLKEWGEKLVRQHRPTSQLDLPDFMQPRVSKPAAARASEDGDLTPSNSNAVSPVAEMRKLLCATCGTKITFAEGKFCWNQEQRFGGYQYCREHQAAF